MDEAGRETKREILSQPETWAATLGRLRDAAGPIRQLWQSAPPAQTILTGCGSTYYAAAIGATVLQALTGVPSRGVPASELLLYPESIYPRAGRTMLVAISRSGATSETIKAATDFVAANAGPLVTLSASGDEPLARLGALNLVFPEAQERSIVQTRAFTSLLLATLALAALWSGRDDLRAELDRLPAAGSRVIDQFLPRMADLAAAPYERSFFLGSGPHFGLACEAALKTKEVSLQPSEPFHFLEFRHGPKSLVTPETLVVGLLGAHIDLERPVIAESAGFGGQTLTVGEADADLPFASGLSEFARGVLALPPIQWLACERALAQGLDPDHPRNLSAVITLDLGG
ncbi:MAG TPA: SIS domain-containing protein [Thermomicrobiales bacterium]|nr:SIS domain-containing protein [Thermomicrobiales bacterium]